MDAKAVLRVRGNEMTLAVEDLSGDPAGTTADKIERQMCGAVMVLPHGGLFRGTTLFGHERLLGWSGAGRPKRA